MGNIESPFASISQNDRLPIRIVSRDFGHTSPENGANYGLTHRLSYYFFIFMLDGSCRYGVDLGQLDLGKNEFSSYCRIKFANCRLPRMAMIIIN